MDGIIREVRYRFNLDADIAAFCEKFKNDRVLGPALKRWKGMRPVAANSLYETLMIYFVLQNATVRRSVQMLENLFARLGRRVSFDGKVLSAFWEPRTMERLREGELRALKLGYRAKSFKKATHQFVSGAIDEFALRTMPTAQLRKALLNLYGIGPASVEYLLFEDFYRYGELETIPPWDQKILSRLLYGRAVPAQRILRDAERRWGVWKKLALHYLWEDLFWQRRTKHIPWLEQEIRL